MKPEDDIPRTNNDFQFEGESSFHNNNFYPQNEQQDPWGEQDNDGNKKSDGFDFDGNNRNADENNYGKDEGDKKFDGFGYDESN